MLRTNKLNKAPVDGRTGPRNSSSQHRGPSGLLRRRRTRHPYAKPRSPLKAYLSVVGPSQVILTRRLEKESEAYVWATAWKGRQRRFPAFSFTSSRPAVAGVEACGPDCATVRGISTGATTITASTDGARASVRLTVVSLFREDVAGRAGSPTYVGTKHESAHGHHGLGPRGHCVCPKCEFRKRHQARRPCQEDRCPRCGARLLREGSDHHALWLNKHGRE
jgi:hypothetical protein